MNLLIERSTLIKAVWLWGWAYLSSSPESLTKLWTMGKLLSLSELRFSPLTTNAEGYVRTASCWMHREDWRDSLMHNPRSRFCYHGSMLKVRRDCRKLSILKYNGGTKVIQACRTTFLHFQDFPGNEPWCIVWLRTDERYLKLSTLFHL